MNIATNTCYLEKASALAGIFSEDAVERDRIGGIPKKEKDAIRESGLLHLIVPQMYGGEGESWSTVFRLVREFAKTDPSIAYLYGNHFLQLVNPHLTCSSKQKAHFYKESVKNDWFWGGCFYPFNKELIGISEGNRVILNGKKTYSVGSQDADRVLISWLELSDEAGIGGAVIPIDREGVTVNDDWDGIGQKQTESGTVTFTNVIVEKNEILDRNYASISPFSTIGDVLNELLLANVITGTAEGSLTDAAVYTKSISHPYPLSEAESNDRDPFVLRKYGDLWIKLQGVISIVEKASRLIDVAWEKEHALSEEERGQCLLQTDAAHVAATTVGLDITNDIFEVMGEGSADKRYGLDRFWRNVRTYTLQNPLDHKRKNIGNWLLNDEYTYKV
ncbi:acyl-CoA dehydrogenase family protein [Aquibacillus albus]|uniref:Alkylation response protein AidB-like acyl-CoA dehydrogenase n=1 Tax=Aquibacillus albus TaxID=1168171 RepID=A0ABS2MZ56_9BACI|nr:acyl-CoA dehydrogenase family protein [Aquibacillus albus]MBM7571162.1 alkylation response protein AidB-like acyl-CoA dehydrogenase [Aquibacillus albus]